MLLLAGPAARASEPSANAATSSSTPAPPIDRTFRLDYRAPPDCPSRDAFVERLRRRESAGLLDVTDSSSRLLLVQLETLATNTRARLVVREAEGKETERSLTASDCDEAVDALALIAALLLVPAEPKTPFANPKSTRDEPRRAPPPPASTWFSDVELSASLVDGAAPSVLGGARASWGIGLDRSSFWSPSLRLGALVTGSRTFETSAGDAHFQLVAFTLEACPFRWSFFDARTRVHLCALSEAGVLRASGSSVDVPASHDVRWITLGGSLQFEVRLTKDLSLPVHAALLAPLLHDRFLFDDTVVFSTPHLGARAGLGLRWRFASF